MSKIKEELENIDYSFKFLFRSKWMINLTVLFILTVILYIPFSKKIDSIVHSSITNIPGCPISIGDYHFEFFTPKIVLNKINVDGRCLGNSKKGLKLEQVYVYFRGLSFSPFGPSIKIKTVLLNNEIEAFIIPGFSSYSVLLENESKSGEFTSPVNKINLGELNQFIPLLKLAGDIVISTAYLQMGYDGKLKDIALNVASDNFYIPGQKIHGFRINKLAINSVLLQVTSLKNNKIRIKKLVLGDDKAPILASFSGDMNLNLKRISSSFINVRGELSISEDIEKNYFLLKTYLDQFDEKDKFYQIQIKGNLGSPKISTAR
jgi:hypothetical protein